MDLYPEYRKNSPKSTKKIMQFLKTGKRLEQTFHKRRYMKDKGAHKKCSIPLVIREIQVKNTTRYQFMSNRMVKI